MDKRIIRLYVNFIKDSFKRTKTFNKSSIVNLRKRILSVYKNTRVIKENISYRKFVSLILKDENIPINYYSYLYMLK